MSQKLVPVSREQHRNTKIKTLEGYQFAAQTHIATLMIQEFARAAAIYPIVFLPGDGEAEFSPVVLLGLDEGQNLYVEPSGRWQATYIPAIVRRYPFAVARTSNGQFTVCIDENSSLLNESVGDPLFTEEGEPTTILTNAQRYLGELRQMEEQTQAFCKKLVELDLLTPLNLRVNQNNKAKNISGCYMISEERLNKLGNDDFSQFRTQGFLPAIYAHLVSLGQVERLVNLKDGRKAA